VLTNRSLTEAVDACLGPARTFTLVIAPMIPRDHKRPIAMVGRGQVDHPYCVSRFHLAPGATLSWQEAVDVPDLGMGDADLFVGVQVVHPGDCDQYGCYDTEIKARPLRLHIQSAGLTTG
jgi:hypothetical protein